MIPVVDGHHHIWRQADLPWLVGPMQPRIFGPYEPIRRDYPIEEFRADLDGLGVVKSVYVQTNWAPGAYEEEAAWVQRTADRSGWPHAIVAYADVGADDVRPQLDRLSRYPLVHGVRMQLHWHENPQYRFAARSDLAADPTIRRNIGRLADYGLSFDLQVFAPQMADAHLNLALAYEKVGRKHESTRHLSFYLRYDPNGPWADFARTRLASQRPPGDDSGKLTPFRRVR